MYKRLLLFAVFADFSKFFRVEDLIFCLTDYSNWALCRNGLFHLALLNPFSNPATFARLFLWASACESKAS
jgi:hypothetical protein